jgi:hypothetical protein
MFLLKHNLPFVDDKYETPTLLLRQKNNYAPFLRVTNNVDYLQQIDFAVQDLITILYTMLTPMEEVEESIANSIDAQLLFLRENYPLKYTSYAKSCTTISSLLFSNNSVEFEDAQLSVVYNEFLNGERLTLEAQVLILGLNTFLNEQVLLANEKITFINTYGNAAISTLDLVTNYREQNYINIINDKIEEATSFFKNYYTFNYAN